jgi:hypothetical protein
MAAGPSAEVGLNYMAQQRAARAKAEEAILAEEERQMESALTGRREASKAGLKGFEVGTPGQIAGTRGLADLANARRLEEANRLEAASRALSTESAVAANRYGSELQAAVSAANNAATLLERSAGRDPQLISALVARQTDLIARMSETERKFRDDERDRLDRPGGNNLRIADALRNPNTEEKRRLAAEYTRDLNQRLNSLLGPARTQAARIEAMLNQVMPGGAPGGGAAPGAVDPAARARQELERRLRQTAGGQ